MVTSLFYKNPPLPFVKWTPPLIRALKVNYAKAQEPIIGRFSCLNNSRQLQLVEVRCHAHCRDKWGARQEHHQMTSQTACMQMGNRRVKFNILTPFSSNIMWRYLLLGTIYMHIYMYRGTGLYIRDGRPC